jgi:hypothetical protein
MTSPTTASRRSSPVTRREVASAVARAFGSGAVHRDAIVATARRAGARAEVLALLERLPAYRYQEIGQLWPVMPPLANR